MEKMAHQTTKGFLFPTKLELIFTVQSQPFSRLSKLYMNTNPESCPDPTSTKPVVSILTRLSTCWIHKPAPKLKLQNIGLLFITLWLFSVMGFSLQAQVLTNGLQAVGNITLASPTNAWSFQAVKGETILLRMGADGFNPHIDLRGPDGALIKTASNGSSGGRDAELVAQIPSSGTFQAVFSTQYAKGVGPYRVTLVSSASDFIVGSDDEGGDLQNGGLAQGFLGVGDLDLWRFTATKGDTILARVGVDGFNPILRLMGPDGVLVDSEWNGSAGGRDVELSVQATNTGTFVLVVGNYYASGTGAYRLSLVHAPSPIQTSSGDEGGPLTNGATHPGTLQVGDLDAWTFDATAGSSAILRVGTGGFNPTLRAYNPNGQLIGNASNGTSGARDTELSLQLTNTGRFIVVVSSYYANGASDYALSFVLAPGDLTISASDEGGPLTNGAQHPAKLAVGDLDAWTFEGQAGDSAVFRVGSVDFNPNLRLFGPTGIQVGSATSGSSGVRDMELAVQLTNSGRFTLVVSSYYANNNGDYVLSFLQAPEAFVTSNGDQGGPLQNGHRHAGNLAVGDLDAWSFNAKAGESAILRVGAVDFNPRIRLFGPSGKIVGDISSGSSGNRDVDLSATITNSGIYTVLISSYYANNHGDYGLSLSLGGEVYSIASDDEGGPLSNGAKNPGTLPVGDLDLWSFQANAGDGVVLRVGADAFNPQIRVMDPSGALIANVFSGSSGAHDIEWSGQVTNTGTFYVTISSYYANGTGAYALTLAHAPGSVVVSPNDQGGTLVNGFKHQASLDVGDLDVWTFPAEAGDAVLLRIGATSFNPELRLYGPNGALLSLATSGSSGSRDIEIATRATNSGPYTVVVSSYYGNGTGPYSLTLAQAPGVVFVAQGDEGGALTNAISVSGKIDVGDLDLWTFTACRTHRIVLELAATPLNSGFHPQMRLYGYDGALLGTSPNTASGKIEFTVPRSGPFWVAISSAIANQNGDYVLTATGIADGEATLCYPLILGSSYDLAGIGGQPGQTGVVLTSTDLTVPRDAWTPLFTNQFNVFGLFEVTNHFDIKEPMRFFELRTE